MTRFLTRNSRFCSRISTKYSNKRFLHVEKQLKNEEMPQIPSLKPRNFSFSGSGFLISYHLGVAHGLQKVGALTKESKVGGASGGALASMIIASGMDLQEAHEDAKQTASLCHTDGTLWKIEDRLRQLLKRKMEPMEIEAVKDRLTVTTHRVWPSREIIHHREFESKEDLLNALITSCYVPMYLAPQLVTRFRGEYHVDGGLIELVPELPGYVKVCVFHAHHIRRPDYEISPSLYPNFPYSLLQLLRFSLFPPDTAVLDHLYQLGTETALIWARNEAEKESKQQFV